MDGSTTRRGRLCWYKTDNIGMQAVNDSFYLNISVYIILQKYIRDEPYYMDVIELLQQTTMQTIMGQSLDMDTAPPAGVVDFSNFTMERYDVIVKWKTGFYSFYLPVALGMHMAGVVDPNAYKVAKMILLKIGHFFQVQDDFLDCFGDPDVIGKIGTDIEENKCSWLIVKALEIATAEQKNTLMEHYGRHDDRGVESVKDVYRDLGISSIYQQFEADSYRELLSLIHQQSDNLPKSMFMDVITKIYRRHK